MSQTGVGVHIPAIVALNRSATYAGYLVLLGVWTGCVSSAPLLVDLNTAEPRHAEKHIGGCIIHIAPVIDERASRNDLGMLGPQVIHGDNVIPWVQQAVDILNPETNKNAGTDRVSASARQVDIQFSLKRLYVHSLQTSMGANILLVGHYRVDQGPPQSHLYRGSETSVNWTGSAASIVDLLDVAMDGIIARMRADLLNLC